MGRNRQPPGQPIGQIGILKFHHLFQGVHVRI